MSNEKNEALTVPEVPAHLLPAVPEQDVAVAIEPERVVSDAEVDKAAKQLGLVTLNADTMKALATLGVYTSGDLALQLSRGRTLVTLVSIKEFLERLDQVAENSGDDLIKISASTTASSLFDKAISAEKHLATLLQLQPRKSNPNGKKRNRSFAPGANVTINQQFVGQPPAQPATEVKP